MIYDLLETESLSNAMAIILQNIMRTFDDMIVPKLCSLAQEKGSRLAPRRECGFGQPSIKVSICA